MKTSTIGIIFVASLTLFGTLSAASIYTVFQISIAPDKIMSNATQECVRLKYQNGKIDKCENAPELYNEVWVD
jgi:hypothetical protein